jgi:hypothetical protein
MSLIYIFIFFFYIFSPQLAFAPFGSRTFFAIIGLFLFLNNYKKFICNRGFLTILLLIFIICVFSLATIFLNNTGDYSFLIPQFLRPTLIIILGSYGIIFILKEYHNFDIDKLLKAIIYVVLLHSILAFFMYIFPAFHKLMMSFLILDDVTKNIVKGTEDQRLIGFGISFFGAGVINGLSLIIIAILVKLKKRSNIELSWLALCYILLFVLGVMLARTTIVGLIFSICIFFSPISGKGKSFAFILRVFIIMSIGIIFFFLIFFSLKPAIQKSISKLSEFAFEIIINYSKTGEASSNSMSNFYLYHIVKIPNSFHTYLIGDGYFSNEFANKGVGLYYMQTDVGYYRLLYFFGIIGTLLYFYFQFYITKLTSFLSRDKVIKLLLWTMLIYNIVVNIKGLVDQNVFLILIYLFFVESKYHSSKTELIK